MHGLGIPAEQKYVEVRLGWSLTSACELQGEHHSDPS